MLRKPNQSNDTTNNSTTTQVDIILFLDLDIKNRTADWVDKLVMTILEDN